MIESGALLDKANNKYGETPLTIASCEGHLEIVKVLIASGALLDKANKYGCTPLYIASCKGHLEIVKVLIANKANFFYMNIEGKTPLDVSKTQEIRDCITNHPWYRRRPLILTRPHADHESETYDNDNDHNDDTEQQLTLTPLGEIITTKAKKGNDLSSQDDILFQIKIKIASFL